LKEPVARLGVETTLRNLGGNLWVNFNSEREGRIYDAPAGSGSVQVHLPSLPLVAGNYLARVRMWDTERCQLVAETPARFPLHVDDRGKITGMLALPNHWSQRVDSKMACCDDGVGQTCPAADASPVQTA